MKGRVHCAEEILVGDIQIDCEIAIGYSNEFGERVEKFFLKEGSKEGIFSRLLIGVEGRLQNELQLKFPLSEIDKVLHLVSTYDRLHPHDDFLCKFLRTVEGYYNDRPFNALRYEASHRSESKDGFYYIVGSPICDKQSRLFSTKTRQVKPEELYDAFYNQETVRLFTSIEEAKQYADGLRKNADDYTQYPKTAAARSKVRPIFKIEGGKFHDRGPDYVEFFIYKEKYHDDQRYVRERLRCVKTHFTIMETKGISKEMILSAEFVGSNLPMYEQVRSEESGKHRYFKDA